MCASLVHASDAITIDSLFKKQIGLRSITKFSLLTSGNANSYMLYPNISQNSDPTIWTDTKELFADETLIYTVSPKFDMLASFGGSFARREFTDMSTNEFKHENDTSFHSLWLGGVYTADSMDELVPQITFQAAVLQKERAAEESKKFYLHSYSLQASLKGYSDPAIYSLYIGFGYNKKREFKFATIEYGNTYYFGGDLSIVLSPKITLDVGIKQTFQTRRKINSYVASSLRSMATYSIGSTYSLNDDSAVSFGVDLGGSSSAPDSVFGISIWKKF